MRACGAWIFRLALLLATIVAPTSATAEPVTTIRANGSSANRVDLVIMGDGFTAGEISSGVYRQAIEGFVSAMFAQEPYREYARAYNVHLVDVVSNQSGSDHPDSGIFVDTALDSRFDCGGIQRLICVDTSKVNAVLTRSAIPANARDLVLVIVNDRQYGGSGGSVAVASIHTDAVELILHEVGHTFALLADEYTSQPPTCNPAEPSNVNATAETRRSFIKWAHWIDPSTPIPTVTSTPGIPGLYQGAAYCPTALYRPTNDSKMRSLGRPFEQINTEQHVRRIYNLMSPIDAVSPPPTASSIRQGDLFTVTTFRPLTHDLDVTWRVDGVTVATGPQFYTSGVSLGPHQIAVTVRDSTPFVRSAPAGLLDDTATWNVVVDAALPNSAPTELVAVSIVGNEVTISWRAPTATVPTGYVLEGGLAPGQTLASIPTGSAATTYSFTAPTGAFYIRVHALVGTSRSAASNEIQIFVNVPAPPSAPANLLGLADGFALTLAWHNTAAGGAASAIRLDVTGALATSLTLPLSERFAFAGVPAGTYNFEIRAVNAAGISGASNRVTLVFPGTCSPPLTPASFSVSTSGSLVTASWGLPVTGSAPSGYQLLVSGAFNGSIPLAVRSISAIAAPGTYTLSVVAINACGQSAATPAQTITIP